MPADAAPSPEHRLVARRQRERDCSTLRDELKLKNVQEIQASHNAFSAVLAWGGGGVGMFASKPGAEAVAVQATARAFAAILRDGSILTWGDIDSGGDCEERPRNVQQIQASFGAFAAILADGSVLTWGAATHGGTAVQCRAS